MIIPAREIFIRADLIPAIQRAYRQADAVWRLPMYGGPEAFPEIGCPSSHATRRTRARTRARRSTSIRSTAALAPLSIYGADGSTTRSDSTARDVS